MKTYTDEQVAIFENAFWVAREHALLHHGDRNNVSIICDKALATLRSGQDGGEPECWMHVQGNYKEPSSYSLDAEDRERGWTEYPLYAAPQSAQIPADVARDAARYRWLREMHDSSDNVTLWHVRGSAGQPLMKGELDAAIDAAMAQRGTP